MIEKKNQNIYLYYLVFRQKFNILCQKKNLKINGEVWSPFSRVILYLRGRYNLENFKRILMYLHSPSKSCFWQQLKSHFVIYVIRSPSLYTIQTTRILIIFSFKIGEVQLKFEITKYFASMNLVKILEKEYNICSQLFRLRSSLSHRL